MTWSNWISSLNQVLDFFIALVPRIVALIMESPIIGVPVIMGIVSVVLGVVVQFIGAFGTKKNKES